MYIDVNGYFVAIVYLFVFGVMTTLLAWMMSAPIYWVSRKLNSRWFRNNDLFNVCFVLAIPLEFYLIFQLMKYTQ